MSFIGLHVLAIGFPMKSRDGDGVGASDRLQGGAFDSGVFY